MVLVGWIGSAQLSLSSQSLIHPDIHNMVNISIFEYDFWFGLAYSSILFIPTWCMVVLIHLNAVFANPFRDENVFFHINGVLYEGLSV